VPRSDSLRPARQLLKYCSNNSDPRRITVETAVHQSQRQLNNDCSITRQPESHQLRNASPPFSETGDIMWN
jgi:hypothetical protein